MPRSSRPAKVREWSDRLDRFAGSGQTVTDFCKSEGVSTPSFYYWRRRIGQHAEAPAPPSPTFRPVRLLGQPAVTTDGGLIVHLPTGITITVGSDPQLLQRVLEATFRAGLRDKEARAC